MAAKLKFSESILINAPREAVFDFTQDYNKRLKWDSFLIRAELINSATKADV
ncbi:MAG: SRPBCC family protein, partial [Flavobacterium sp.]